MLSDITTQYYAHDQPAHTIRSTQVPLYERAALYSIADCAVVTATRDGMNLVPYEYVVCRQGVPVSGGEWAS